MDVTPDVGSRTREAVQMDASNTPDGLDQPDDASPNNRLGRQVLRLAPWLVLLLSLSITWLAWRSATTAVEQAERTQFDFRVREVLVSIEQRMQAYEHTLLAVNGLFEGSVKVDREEFREFFAALHLADNFPGIQGVGFALLIPAGELESHVNRVRKEGFPAYSVQPDGQRDTYTAIYFLEPFVGRNLRAFGFDMYSEPVRRSAMDRARDSGEPAISGKVRLVQEVGKEEQAGFLMYLPIFRRGLPHSTPDERRAAIVGWAYAPFRMNDLLEGIQGERTNDLDLEIYDGATADAVALMYDADRSPPREKETGAGLLEATNILNIAGHPWTVVSRPLPGLYRHIDRNRPTVIGILGALMSLMLSWLVWGVIGGRQRALTSALRMNRDLRETEARFRLMADSAPVLIWIAGADKRYVWFNKKWLEFTGQPPDKEKGFGWMDGIHADDLKRYFDIYYDHFEHRNAFTVEYRLKRHDGQWRWLADNGIPRFDKNGEFAGYIGSCVDITDRKIIEEALLQSEENFRRQSLHLAEIIWATNIGTWEWNVQNGETRFNQRWAEIAGYTLEELMPTSIETWARLAHPEDLKRSRELLQRSFKRELDAYACEVRMRHKNGHWVWVLDRGRVVEWTEDGKPLRMSGTHTDITERKEAEARLQLAANVFTHARESILITDGGGTIIDVNETFTRVTGYSREEALGNNPRMLKSGRQDKEFYAAFWRALLSEGHWSGEIWNRRKDGALYIELLTVSAVRDHLGKPQNYVALFTDITPLKEYQSKLESLAHYDALTGLPNRVLLADRMQHAIAQCQRRGDALAVVYLDLDGFKAVNDTCGHAIGDELLIAVSHRMKEALRDGDTLARIGGDEFVAVLVDLATPPHCEPILERLLRAAADPVVVREHRLHVSASVGVTLFPTDQSDPDRLMRHADQAMYQAKQAGKNCYRIFEPGSDGAPGYRTGPV